jgi:hypothetical protein
MSLLPTLSIRHRSLRSRAAPSDKQLMTREIASGLIIHHGAPRTVSRAEQHLGEAFGCEVVLNNGQLTFALSSNTNKAAIDLSPPYGLKGGAARELFAALAHQRLVRPPRDIDLVRRGSFVIAADEVAAKSLMPHDYKHGARVELIRSMPKYLTSRDVTVNELAVFDDVATVSLLGALDTLGHTLRPSRYRGGSIHKLPSLDGRIFLKMVRLFAEAECHGDPVQLVGIPDQISFSEFDLALHLDKAFQRSIEVARRFVDTLVLLGALPASSDPLALALEELSYLRYGENGLLQHAPALTPKE